MLGDVVVAMELIDHNHVPAGEERFDAVEVVYGDGGSVYFTAASSGSLVYRPADVEQRSVRDGTTLMKHPGGGSSASDPYWTLSDPAGQASSFGTTDTSTGRSRVLGVQLEPATSDATQLTYLYGSSQHPGLLTRVTDTSGRSMQLAWNAIDAAGCADAIVCVTGPDERTWKYVGDAAGGSAGKLVVVNNGVRDVMKVGWTAGRIDRVYNTNDLSPAEASPGYDGTHELQIAYLSCSTSGCFDGAVAGVTDTNVSSDGSTTSVGYGFKYGGLLFYKPHATQASHEGAPAGATRTAGYLTRVYTLRNVNRPGLHGYRVTWVEGC